MTRPGAGEHHRSSPHAEPRRVLRRGGPIAWLLLRASGVDPLVAQRCQEQRRYEIYGGLVLFTTTMAMISLAWAVSIATNAPPAIIVAAAAIWGFGIFHIDQWLVSSHLESDRIGRRLWLLVPRLTIAVPMGLTIAWFAMLGIASKEIEEQLTTDRITRTTGIESGLRADADRRLTDLETRRQRLLDAADQARKVLEARVKDYDDEISGAGGTKSAGNGPVARKKNALLELAKADYNRAKAAADAETPQIERQIDDVQEQIEREKNEKAKVVDHNDGLFARRAALDTVLGKDDGARRLYLLLEVVFVVVDVVPAIAKIFSPTSEVDRYYRRRKEEYAKEYAIQDEVNGSSGEVAEARKYAARCKGERIRIAADADSYNGVPAARNGHRRGKTPAHWRPY